MGILIAILAFCVIIIIHELGHFLVARAFNMNAFEFSIGMGPTIFRKKGKKTDFTLKLLPIGGSVRLEEDVESDDPNSFRNKPVWQRMLVIVAGAVMNIILGIIICFISVLCSNQIVTTTIKGFHSGAATSAVLQANDEIVKINGMSIWTPMDISYKLQNSVPKKATDKDVVYYDFVVKRDGNLVEVNDVSFKVKPAPDGSNTISLDFYVYTEPKDFFNVISTTFKSVGTEVRLIWVTLLDMLTGTYGINDLAGPIGVVSTIGEAASTMSIDNLLTMIAFITLNVGIFNLLPIPALDGARFVFLLVEAIRRKPIKPEIEGMVHFIGLAALMLLMLVVTFNDIGRIFFGNA